MNRRSRLVLLAALAIATVQCGGSEDDASSGETPPASDITLDNFPKLLADAMCKGADSCCRSVSYSSSSELCRETVEGIPQAYQWDMYLAAGAVFDAHAAHACLELWRHAVEACDLSEETRFVPTGRSFPPCDVLKGTIGIGESCEQGLCAPSSLGTASCNDMGVCELSQVGQLGDTCDSAELRASSTIVECDDEARLSCDPTSGQCEGAVAVGESCADRSCEAFAFCGDAAECLPLPGAGEPCQGSRCAAASSCDPNCSDGLACDFSSRTCAPPAAEGGDCTDIDCAHGLHCGSDLDPDTLVCVPLRAEGEECGAGDSCGTLDCRSGRCAPPRPGFCISTAP